MQQIINFILQNSIRLLFLLLLITSLTLVVKSHSYHRSELVNSANIVSGNYYKKANEVTTYFNLKVENEALAKENAYLKKILFNKKDSTSTLPKDSTKAFDKIDVIQTRVIKNVYNTSENYLTLSSGALSGIKADMGVVSSQGIVGIIEKTSKNFATVLSVLNMKSQINAKIKKSNHFGSLIWNAKNAGYVQLIDVPRLASVQKGDTVVTGGQSTIFPENIPVGIIDKIFTDTENNYYTLNIRLFSDMTNLNHVYVIKNKQSIEINKLETETKKNE